VLRQRQRQFGPTSPARGGATTLRKFVAPVAKRLGVGIQLDPALQPSSTTTDGIVLQLVCQGEEPPGGNSPAVRRYDALVEALLRLIPAEAAGGIVGFRIEENPRP